MTYVDVVKKLIGNVQPCGDSCFDKQRLENLKIMCEIADNLIGELREASKAKNSQKNSMREIGQCADKFLSDVLERSTTL
jgi:hypothetical protein